VSAYVQNVDMVALAEDARKALVQNPFIVFAYLFGSMTTGFVTPMSDIDVAVYLDVGVDLSIERLNVLGALMHQLETDDIDLVLLNTAPLTLKARIVGSNTILIDRKPSLRHSFESLTLREYFDFSRLEEDILKRRFALG
jgi:predicted nucleotidyltransferase